MTKRIDKISLNFFKGATKPFILNLDKDKAISMIFGENGTGKSTIVDSLDFIFNEKLGSLEDKKIGQSKHRYLTAIGNTTDKLKVQIQINGNTITGTLSDNGQKTIVKSGDIPNLEILRRNQILKVINAEPKERFEEIKKFINVVNCQANEDSLREALKSVKADYSESVRAYEQAVEQLKSLWEQEGKPEADFMKWAKNKNKIVTTESGALIKDTEEILRCVDVINSSISDMEKAETAFNTDTEKYNSFKEDYETKQKDLVNGVDELIGTLDSAKKYLEKSDSIENCPVCEKPIMKNDLISQLNTRLDKYKNIIKSKNALQTAENNLTTSNSIFKTRKETYVKNSANLYEFAIASKLDTIKLLKIKPEDYSNLNNKKLIDIEARYNEAKNIHKIISDVYGELKKSKDELLNTQRQLTAIKSNLQTITEKEKLNKKYEIESKKLKDLHDLIEKERKKYLDNVLIKISSEIDKYYEKLHPDEKLGKIKCFMKKGGVGSMEISGTFHNVDDCPPAAYYSESHLDTLGICSFIALAKQYNTDGSILVFDDVLTSVDVVHLDRIMNLLYELKDEFDQIILTSHYRPWREKYKYASGASSYIGLIELRNWSLEKGISSFKTMASLDEIEYYMDNSRFDRQIVASKSGILLEYLLEQVVLIYKGNVPFIRPADYTIAQLFGGIDKKLKAALKIENVNIVTPTDPNGQISYSVTSTIEIKPILDNLENNNWIRNVVGAHYNTLGPEVSDDNVRAFFTIVKNLTKALVCSTCGEIPRRDKSGLYLECKCKKVSLKRMYPFQQPK